MKPGAIRTDLAMEARELWREQAGESTRLPGVRVTEKQEGSFRQHQVIEEFAGQIPIEVLLNLLDIYPLMLPARYNDRVACYDIVYITSNLPLDKQYIMVQQERPETWKALNRRISSVVEFLADGSKIVHKKEADVDGTEN